MSLPSGAVAAPAVLPGRKGSCWQELLGRNFPAVLGRNGQESSWSPLWEHKFVGRVRDELKGARFPSPGETKGVDAMEFLLRAWAGKG